MYALFQLIWCTHVHPGFTLKNRDVQWLILHRQVTVMLFKATVGVVERLCMIMLFGVLPLYVLCHVLTCIGQETINYLILSYLIFARQGYQVHSRNAADLVPLACEAALLGHLSELEQIIQYSINAGR